MVDRVPFNFLLFGQLVENVKLVIACFAYFKYLEHITLVSGLDQCNITFFLLKDKFYSHVVYPLKYFKHARNIFVYQIDQKMFIIQLLNGPVVFLYVLHVLKFQIMHFVKFIPFLIWSSFWSLILVIFNWQVWEASFSMRVFSSCLDFPLYFLREQDGKASTRFRLTFRLDCYLLNKLSKCYFFF